MQDKTIPIDQLDAENTFEPYTVRKQVKKVIEKPVEEEKVEVQDTQPAEKPVAEKVGKRSGRPRKKRSD